MVPDGNNLDDITPIAVDDRKGKAGQNKLPRFPNVGRPGLGIVSNATDGVFDFREKPVA